MELRQLRYFLAAARHLNFTEAARECCIVQSAMSQQMRALEKDLDAELFERTKQGLRLTREGEALRREAERLLDQVTLLQNAVLQAKESGECLLRVGCQSSVLRIELPRALAALRAQRPRLSAQVKCDMQRPLLSGLREGRLDCAVMLLEDADLEGLACRVVSEEVICAMLPASSPLAQVDAVRAEDLRDCTLVLSESEKNNPLLEARLNEFFSHSRRRFVDPGSGIETLVAAGCGVSLCVRSAARSHPDIVYRPLSWMPRLRVALVWQPESPRASLSEELASLLMMAPSKTIGVQ